jgi:hypothetical protein
MKALFTTLVLLVIMALMLIPGQSYAQSGTLVVYANSSFSIDQIIANDQTSGVQNHSVYKLVSTDTTYLLEATITLGQSVQIVGVPDSKTGQLPCIQADVLNDGSIPGIFFTLTGQGTTVQLDSLYLLGIAPNNSNNTSAGQGVQISADSIKLWVDNCVFDEMSQFDIAFSSNWNKIYIENSKFRNGIDVASAYYVPELLRSLNGVGAWSTDTIVIKYNTLLGVAMGPVVTTGITHYFDFSHNDVVLTSKGPFWSEQVVNAKLDNNIFYNTYGVGETHTEYIGGWDEIKPPRIPSIFYFATLDSTKAALLLGHAVNGPLDYAAAEALRKVEVKDNVYFWSSGLTSFWNNWNDTNSTLYDSIYTPVFMNSQSDSMFLSINSSIWPGFVSSGNVNVDPGFGTSISSTALTPGSDTTYGVGFLAYIAAVRNGTGTTQSYSYKRTEVGTSASWMPTWPLPESADLKYSNTSLVSTDGLPVGDPYWFTHEITGIKTVTFIPHTYSLSQNYPNPFNPTTQINFSLEKASNVSLAVYNVLGQKVANVVNQFMQAGSYIENFNATKLASGIYFYRIEAGDFVSVKKMVLMK